MRMVLTGQLLNESAIFAMDNGWEASRCGQDWLRDRELLVLYTYQTSWFMPREVHMYVLRTIGAYCYPFQFADELHSVSQASKRWQASRVHWKNCWLVYSIWPVSTIVLNLVMQLPWEKFEILIFCAGTSRSFPSPPPLHYLSCAPDSFN